MVNKNINYQELEEKANLGAFSQYDMKAIIPDLQKLAFGIYVEIGTDKGRSLSIAKMVTNESILLYGIDINKQVEVERILDNRTFFIWSSSEFAGSMWNNISGDIDILFIDGDHSYEGCKKDIEVWYPYIKKGGVIFLHDYDISSPGVIQAVDEFIKKENLSLEVCKEKYGNTSMVRIQL